MNFCQLKNSSSLNTLNKSSKLENTVIKRNNKKYLSSSSIIEIFLSKLERPFLGILMNLIILVLPFLSFHDHEIIFFLNWSS